MWNAEPGHLTGRNTFSASTLVGTGGTAVHRGTRPGNRGDAWQIGIVLDLHPTSLCAAEQSGIQPPSVLAVENELEVALLWLPGIHASVRICAPLALTRDPQERSHYGGFSHAGLERAEDG